MQRKRTSADLVAELCDAAVGADLAAIVVGYEERTELVWADDPNPVNTLNGHMRTSGVPVGIIAYNEALGEVITRIFHEFREDEEIEKAMLSLVAETWRIATGPRRGREPE